MIWGEWAAFCEENDYDIFSPEHQPFVDWLTTLVIKGDSQTYVEKKRSVVASTISMIYPGASFSGDSLISKVMAAAAKENRPKTRKLDKVFDVSL